MNDDGTGDYVSTLYLKNTQTVLTFAAPGAQSQPPSPNTGDLSRQNALSSHSAAGELGLFTISNPRSQTVPYAEAQALYLSACKVVEQEFGRTDPIRPQLTLVLGANAYTKSILKARNTTHEVGQIQLFTQGVVILAVDDLLPDDMRISLTKLAVVEADSIVGVSDLKK